MKAKEFFTQEWGTGFTKATLSEKNGLLEMSMEDIYRTMERYAELRLSNVVGQSEQLLCECCEDNLVEEQGDWCNDCLENPSRVITK